MSLEEKYLRPGEVCKLLRLNIVSLNNLERDGKVNCVRTKGGHRLFLESDILSMMNHSEQKLPKEKSATATSLSFSKKKSWKDKSLGKSTISTKLLKILSENAARVEKNIRPFWTPESKKMSNKLWLPDDTDSIDSILKTPDELSNSSPMGTSWFSIKRRLPLKKTSSPLSEYSLVGSTPELESVPSEKNYKTLVMRIFPTEEERTKLKVQFEQFRWYWGAALDISNLHFEDIHDKKQKNISFASFRDIIRKYEFVTEDVENSLLQEFVYREDKNSFPVPGWWDKPNSTVIRGAIQKFTSSLNAAISNYKAGNCKHFEMKYLSKKSPSEILHFEDLTFPAYIKKIKSKYWFTTSDRRRIHIPYSQIPSKGGVEVIHEKETERYFLHVPVERNWFPEEDRRIERQATYTSSEDRVIALDPGVRKFLVGYDPEGKCYIIGKGANRRLVTLLKTIDHQVSKGKKTYLLWKKIKNMISELHWKTASFLAKNYDTILLPDFRVGQMVRKGKSLSRSTRRLMNMFSFYKFKTKLQYKCDTYGKKLLIVNESYTSCTCGVCGEITRNSDEIYKCNHCGLVIDRDVIASRNILIKNSTLR